MRELLALCPEKLHCPVPRPCHFKSSEDIRTKFESQGLHVIGINIEKLVETLSLMYLWLLPKVKINKPQCRRCHQNSLKNQMTAEFFKNFD